MTLLRHSFGGPTFAKVADSGGLKEALADPWMESETVVIKPNWVAVTRWKSRRTYGVKMDLRI